MFADDAPVFEIETTTTAMAEGGPTVYKVAQGQIFLKHSEEPAGGRIVKAVRPVGAVIYTTGHSWTGPRGGKWAEIDVARSPGEMGWILVEGPGFGVNGPLLIDPSVETKMQLVQIQGPDKDVIFSLMMQTDQKVKQLIDALCKRTGLNPKEVVLTKGLPGKAPTGSGIPLPVDYVPAKYVLTKDMTIEGADIQEAVHLMYIGHFDEDYRPSAGLRGHGGA